MSSSGSPPLFSLHLSILPPALHPLIPLPFFPPPLSVWTPTSFLSLSASLPLPSVYFFHHPVEWNSKKETMRRKEKKRGPDREGIKELGRGKDNPLCDRWSFYRKTGLSPNFLLIFFVVYFFPCYPSSSFVPTFPLLPRASAPPWQIVWNQ